MADTASTAQQRRPLQRDPLTGLFRQDYMLQRLTDLLRRQRREPVVATLALLQLENFYEIRGWVGKSEADLLLSDIAILLRKCLPEGVLLCRCRHYEFAVLLPEACSTRAHQLTDRIKQELRTATSAAIPPQLELKCAVGLAPVESTIPSADVFFARARHNLSQALNPPHLSVAPNDSTPPSPSRLLSFLRQQRLRVSYQPIAALDGDASAFYELRTVTPPDSPPCSVAALYESAVQNALGERLDRWMSAQALRLLEQDGDRRLLVNLTQNTLVSRRFIAWLEQRIAAAPTRGLVFQISELDLLSAQHHLQWFTEALARLHVGLSVSHFGCTPDPLRYVSLLQAGYVALDLSLTSTIQHDRNSLDQLQALTAQLHTRGLQPIATRVEDMNSLPVLRRAGVTYVQGYCVASPGGSLSFRFPRQRTLEPLVSGRR